MAPPRRARVVYSTDRRACLKCGWPVVDCRCAAAAPAVVPDKIVAWLRIEKAGRGGKIVTVVFGLPKNPAFLKQLAGELKRACSTGGTALEDAVELQGDHREALRSLLVGRGWTVRG